MREAIGERGAAAGKRRHRIEQILIGDTPDRAERCHQRLHCCSLNPAANGRRDLTTSEHPSKETLRHTVLFDTQCMSHMMERVGAD